MTECTNCRRRYDNGVRFCPVDGYAVVAVAEPLVGRVVMGQYAVQSVAGHGATGTVYRALQTGTDREVALKILRSDLLKDPDAVKRFVREARAGARLSHSNIATVHSIGQTEEGAPFIVMEYVEGSPLSAILRVGKPLPLRRIIHIGEQIASALSEAHTQGVVHRDLKPENILLTERRGESDVVKVVDFGIAKMLVHVAPGEDPISRMGTVFGTPHYIAPEQAAGQPVDGRADIYSLGCILFQMATGRVPFDGQQGLQVLLRQVRDPVPDPRSINPRLGDGLSELILSMLAKDPGERPQTVLEVAQSLGELGASDEPAPASGRPRPSGPIASTAAVAARSGGPRRGRSNEPVSPSAKSEDASADAPADALEAWTENAPSLEPFWKRNSMVLLAIGGAIAVGAIVGLVVARMREPSVPVPTTTPIVAPAPLPGSTPTSLIRGGSPARPTATSSRPTPARPPESAPSTLPAAAMKGPAPTTAPQSPAPGPAPVVAVPSPAAPTVVAPAPVVTAPPPATPPAATPAPAATPTAPPTPPAPAVTPPPAAAAEPPTAPRETAPPPTVKEAPAKDVAKDPPPAAPTEKNPDEPGSDPYQQLK